MDIEQLRAICESETTISAPTNALAMLDRKAILWLLDSLARAESDATKLAQRLDEANALIDELSERLAVEADEGR